MTTRKQFNSTFALSAVAFGIAAALRGTPVQAQEPPSVFGYTEGMTIENPTTGVEETIEEVITNPYGLVRTSAGNLLWAGPTTAGQTFVIPGTPAVPAHPAVPPSPGHPGSPEEPGRPLVPERTYIVQAVILGPDPTPDNGEENPGPPIGITVLCTAGCEDPQPEDRDFVAAAPTIDLPPGFEGTPGQAPRDIDTDLGVLNGDVNRYAERPEGRWGSSGRDGYGIEICFFGCWTLGISAHDGDPGERGGDAIEDLNANRGPIVSQSNEGPGIWMQSRGGNGGEGGDAYGALPAGDGGGAGAGGTVYVTSEVNITTTGFQSYGIWAQSRAGSGGDGGNGYIWSGSGDGGPAALAGDSTAINDGNGETTGRIITTGENAIGIYVQSIGGGGGDAGSSYGIVGNAGTAAFGGHAATATAENQGFIQTGGNAAHGVLAQSVGGNGGNGGDVVGLAGIGGGASGGGNGSTATATNSGSIITQGRAAVGLFAQSIGGGGGDGGTGAGIVGVGGSGGAGGNGATATVTNAAGGDIYTQGAFSYGVAAQSIGGGGGNGGVSGGIVGIGGGGTSGGQGGHATANNRGAIETEGEYAAGMLVQSIGGGGGSGGMAGGVVAIGGSAGANIYGASPNNGGEVDANNFAGATIVTESRGAHGILAQSIGGGGGAGGGAGGVAGIGGSGGVGGNGGQVDVLNEGSIQTLGEDAKAIIAQSIGGGGGSGGFAGGVVGIGGTGAGGGGANSVGVLNDTGAVIGTYGRGSDGILAQSIGGGGGSGGSSAGLSALGGAGSTGGVGNTVTVTNRGSIYTGLDVAAPGLDTTAGAWARGILAQSIGGGGGTGGDGSGAIGGRGGGGAAGNSANAVTVSNSGLIATRGNMSSAIEAQSIGGGGGSGGAGNAGFFSIGGNGGSGGNGGQVTVTNDRSLETWGNDSHGIFAQSIGGGGGNGGNASAIGIFGAAAVGGQAGGGGTASSVIINAGSNIDPLPSIHTLGDRAKGILAQSVGGGGGNGGFAVSASGGYIASASASVGGTGGGGGNASLVQINGDTSILTEGSDADGIVAQSIGGSGGNGGFAMSFAFSVGDVAAGAFATSVGGNGGGAGNGNTVRLRNGGDILTTGAQSDGIVAQSVGGGGGNGGFTVAFTGTGAPGANAAASASVGGNGGAGGTGGLVDAMYDGDIRTEGEDAFGVVLQSVGGGGGNGGFTIAGAVAASGTGSAGVAVGVGGGGGTGGAGGQVLSTINGDITTLGDRSTGLVAQSIGGRGGNGGFNIAGSVTGSGGGAGSIAVGVGGAGAGGGAAELVDVTLNGNAVTVGDDADAVVVQSIGGGGGNGGMNVSGTLVAAGGAGGGVAVGIGGEAGSASNGNVVEVTINGNLDTWGRGSNALVAQSIGGSGGNGGLSVAGQLTGTGGGGGGVAVGIGGTGGAGGNASTVTATLNGNAATRGENATAIIAQSLGGGGGNGGMAVSGGVVATGSAGGGAAVGIGGSGGAAGNGDLTTLRITGDVDTLGANSGGVLAQSVGGGGGNGGMSVAGQLTAAGGAGGGVAVGVGGSGGAGGTGGRVDAVITGNVHTRGDQAMGVTAQSLGGGGGNGGLAVSGALTATGSTGGGVAVGVGGSGGGAGDAARVDADLVGNVVTEGDNATGFLAQSLGGSGGNGGMSVAAALSAAGSNSAAVAVGVGGSGGAGGDGEIVEASVTGGALTYGANSAGVVAQSLGGGGGNGGLNVSGALSAGGSNSGSVAVGVGGAGGGAGEGRQTTLLVDGTVETHGVNSAGVIAQSLGGGGGNGGMNVSGAVNAAGSNGAAVAVGVGGAGGSGGSAGLVVATVDGSVITRGANSTGFIAQSIGGSGGNGALNVSGALSATGSSGGSVSVGVGGGGGGAGTGGEVRATVRDGAFDTYGANSHGVLAQSIGGGGGSGGMNVAGAIGGSSSTAAAVAVGVGGSGGGGGDADLVTGDISADIRTRNDDSFGVFLQSVGGGGGSGAMNVSGAMALGNNGAAISVGVGGMGGDGGDGRAVLGTVDGTVLTEGARSIGVLAQSVGGGGGSGGMNVAGALSITKESGGAVSLGVGGFGGNGGDAGTVTLTRTGATATAGADAHGVIAQSIGGGGGNGGMNVSGSIALNNSGNSIAAALGLGGFGGGGGQAETVDLTVDGDVLATGYGSWTESLEDDVLMKRTIANGSNGILAQSVGGSGGNGGMNVSGGIAFDVGQGGSHALSLGVGGFGGGGGHAGTVTLAVTASRVESVGDERIAIAAQSIGGGGGNGGLNVSGGIAMDGIITAGVGGFGGAGGTGSTVTATATVDTLRATGANSVGFLVQSVGGDGGSGAINVSGGIQGASDTSKPSLVFGLGGFGGAGNSSGVVEATQRGDVDVQGRNSIGVFAQSVAGGGGNGALNVTGNLSRGKEYALSVGIGGSGGDGADAGRVTLVSDGNIRADGRESPETPDPPADDTSPESTRFFERSNGLLAQSIGGGGGSGGINATGVAAPNASTLNLGVGGSGGGGGHGGEVFVRRGENAAGTIRTFGNNATGLVAQSVGGGGGSAGANLMLAKSGNKSNAINIGVGGSGAAAGHGQLVDVAHTGNIVTEGHRSIGLLAQSVGGGGGDATYNISLSQTKGGTLNLGIGGDTGPGGDGGDVDVEHRGDISTSGIASAALMAQSVGGGGGNAGVDMIMSFGASKELSIGVGRVGGTGGDGGDVTVVSDGALSTAGDQSIGLFAQSVGKGGGSSSSNSIEAATDNPQQKGEDKAVSLEVGLAGGQGGIAGDVDVTASGSILTEGRDSHGIFAQSVGGGGGTGGAIERQPSAVATSQIMVGVGGSGGEGGIAGAVSVASAADIATAGEKSHGIYAQSLGGGGGTGGHTLAVDLAGDSGEKTSHTIAVSVGGAGGVGSYAKTVDVTNTGTIYTEGRESHGINAESLGGGGGASGAMLSFSRSSGNTSRNLAVNVGGTGGSGAVGDAVTVLNEGTIVTTGDSSTGIRARSIGGKGGDGGLMLHLGLHSVGNEQSAQSLSVNVGGNGGEGGVGGDVTVTNRTVGDRTDPDNLTGVVATQGREAHGIFAQSIGGGGGNGSSIITANAGLPAAGQVTLVDLAFGGRGGTGGVAGDVTVENDGHIQTEGEQSHGIFAQSLGGGGGNGGLVLGVNAVLAAGGAPGQGLLTLGGAGGDGADAGNVVVNNSGSIYTEGERSHGIFAQSIGGGGGNAGVGFGAATNPGTMALAGALSAVFGGRGGEGGLGGLVTVNHTGDITVVGANSQAVVAESINGGGGRVVLDFNGVATLPGVPDSVYDIPVSLPQGIEETASLRFFGGGEDQQDSIAGNVTLNLTGRMSVAGEHGVANSVQAVGGGGGTYDLTLQLHDTADSDDDVAIEGRLGGISGHNNRGGDIGSTHEGDLFTEGDNTPGALVQSIGGGGGRANLDVTSTYGSVGPTDLTLGGEGGENEEGGDIRHDQQGSTQTDGALAHGGVFQSVGGGGGSLTLMSQVTGDEAAPAAARYVPISRKQRGETEPARAIARAAVAPRVSLGSEGGALLKGGQVSLGLDGGVSTSGANAVGMVFQSVGAGGGVANVLGFDGVDVTLGGSAGASGAGGDIDITNRGDVLTAGHRAHGVILQSIGGGGGAVFTDAAQVNVTLESGNVGDGGDIAFAQDGTILVTGAGATALLAQSVAGGGGFVDGAFAGSAGGAGTAGRIDLGITGDLAATGDGGRAVFAQSVGADGVGGDITVTLADGNQVVGGLDGIAAQFDGGAANTFTNRGALYTLSRNTGLAFLGGAGGDFLDNYGGILGNLDFGGGANRFANNPGAAFYAGESVNLGEAGNELLNEGLLSPGGGGLAVHTQLAGSYRQAAIGRADLELDFASRSADRLTATGTARIGGLLDVRLLNPQFIRSGNHFQPLFVAEGGVVSDGVVLEAQPSVVIDYRLLSGGPRALGLSYTVDFSPVGLEGNRIDMGDYLNRVTVDGAPGGLEQTVAAAVLTTDLGSYATLLTQLGAEFYAEQQAVALSGVQRFARNLQDCGTLDLGETAGDETGCFWARYDDNPSTREAGAGFPAGSDASYSISSGVQVPRDGGWMLGVAFDFEDHQGRGYDNLWASDSTFIQFGASLRRELPAASFGATLSVGHNAQQVTRTLALDEILEAEGKRSVYFLSNVLDYTWNLSRGGFSFQPSLNLGTSMLYQSAMREEGAGVLSATLDRATEYHVWAEPALGARYVLGFANGGSLRTFARLGYLQYLSGTSTKVRAGLAGAPENVMAMRTGSDLDRNHWVSEAGLQWQGGNGLTVSFSYMQRQSAIRDGGAGSFRFLLPLQ